MNRRKGPAKPVLPAWRNRALLAVFALAVVALEGRLAWLQLVEGEFLTAQGERRHLREVEMPVHRARFLDRHGEPLAVSTPVDSIAVNPQSIPLDRERIFALANATGRDGEELEREITSSMHREFIWVERHLAPAPAARAMELGIDGVEKHREYRRYYPSHEVTCHLLGFTDTDDAGIQGLEYFYNSRLTGEPGLKRVQRDERGRVIADVEQIRAPRPGRDVRLSIDMRLQFPAYRELKHAVRENGASWGSLVILDVDTGEVLAMANQPSCNPNDHSQRNLELYRNRAVTDPIEPGSTIKPLVMAAALASGYTPDTLIDVPRNLEIGGRILTSDTQHFGVITVTEVLANSSSVGMATIGLELAPADLWLTLKSFGLASGTESQLRGSESKGTLSDYGVWNDTAQATLSYGYGVSLTPLQLARAYAAIASGGLLPPVSFEALAEPPERERVISPEIAAELMQMLEVVVSEDGTAWRAAIPNYSAAGKTGTARIPVPGGYSNDRYRAIFAGMAPASDPRFVAVIVINDPRGEQYYGGEIAAPVFASVIGTALRMYAVAPDAVDAPAPSLARPGDDGGGRGRHDPRRAARRGRRGARIGGRDGPRRRQPPGHTRCRFRRAGRRAQSRARFRRGGSRSRRRHRAARAGRSRRCRPAVWPCPGSARASASSPGVSTVRPSRPS